MESNMEDKVFSKDFHQLTSSERESYSELFTSAEEFRAIKDLYSGIARYRQNSADSKYAVKEKLDALFHEQFGEEKLVNWRIVSRIAAVSLVLVGSFLWWILQTNSSVSKPKPTLQAKQGTEVAPVKMAGKDTLSNWMQTIEEEPLLAANESVQANVEPEKILHVRVVNENMNYSLKNESMPMTVSAVQEDVTPDSAPLATRIAISTQAEAVSLTAPDLKDGIYQAGEEIRYSSEWNDSLLLLVQPVFQ